MGLHLYDGGHLSHGWKVNLASQLWNSIPYHVNPRTGLLDMEEVRELALKHRPKLIWCGATAYSQTIPFKEFSEIADESGSYLVADISYIAGLIAGKAHPSPHTHTHIITTTTHKTLRGPRSGMIMVTEKGLEKDPELGNKINEAIFPRIQGGPHMEKIFGIATMLHLVSTPLFEKYANQVVQNAQCLAESISDNDPTIRIVSGGTDNHQMLLDLSRYGKGRGVFAQLALESVGIICNKNTVPGDLSTPFYPSGIRIGTPTLTSRGADQSYMITLGKLLSQTISKAMVIVNDEPIMNTFPDGTKTDRAQVLRTFKEKLQDETLFNNEKLQVSSFIENLENLEKLENLEE